MSTISVNSDQTSILENPVVDSGESSAHLSPRHSASQPQKTEADWKVVFTEKMQERGLRLQQKTMESIERQRRKEEKMKLTSPIDELSEEWFSQDEVTVETRAYLLDKLLPSIVPGVEALLMEIERKKVIENDAIKFDPLNFLGEYLMRNNPAFNCDKQDLPYVRGLKEVLADLKNNVFGIECNRLGQLKQEMREIQNQRAQVGNIQVQVKQKRKEALAIQFQEWTLDASGRIPLALIQSGLKSFLDVIPRDLIEDKPAYDIELETVETMKQKLSREEFEEYVYTFIHHFSTDLFQEFLHHLAQCADMFRETIRHDIWRQMFSDLFIASDHGKVGFLDRQRVLALMETFYDNITSETEDCNLRNPRQWPVIELGEMDPADFWVDFQKGAQSTKEDSTTFTAETGIYLTAEEYNGLISAEQPPGNRLETETEMMAAEGEMMLDVSLEEQFLNQEQTISELTTVCIIGNIEEEGVIVKSSEREGEPSRVKVLKDETNNDKKIGMRAVTNTDAKAVEQESRVSHDSLTEKDVFPEGQISHETNDLYNNVIQSQFNKKNKTAAAANQLSQEMNSKTNDRAFQQGQIEIKINESFEGSDSPLPTYLLGMQRENQMSDTEIVQEGLGGSMAEEILPGITRQELSPTESVQQAETELSAQTESEHTSQGEIHHQSEREAEHQSEGEICPQSQGETGPQSEGELQDETGLLSERAQQDSTLPAKEEEDSERSGKEVHFIEDKPWSGELLTNDLALRYSSYGARSQDEYRAEASKFPDLCPIISDINSRGSSRITSAFNSNVLTLPQFVQLMETFLGEGTPSAIVKKLIDFIKKEYVETEEERMSLLTKVHQVAIVARQKLVLQALFEKWDNEGTGFLELEEVEAVLSKYKEGMESEVMVKGRERLSSSQSQRQVLKLKASEFCKYILGVVNELPGPEHEVYESLVEFLTSSVERTQAERMRGASRRKWLQQILAAAKTSGGSLEPVYKAVFQALYKDAEAHGNNKKISANIGLLEQSSPGKGWTEVLRYVACTSEDATYILNKTLHRDMKGISFAAVYNGKPLHVPRVQYHGNIHFWNNDRPEEESKGSFIILPLLDAQQRVFGTLGIDTLREPRERNIFLAHEISFYQGVTNAFSTAFHHVQVQKAILQLVSSALSWIYSRAPNIHIINTYMMEPTADMDYVFRNMMQTDNCTGLSKMYSSPALLRRRDNLFRDYLFKCADSSEVITTDAYGERHIAVPIRDPTGCAVGVLDLSTGQCRDLPAHEYQDLQKMLHMLQEACNEVLEEQQFGETKKKPVLEAEQVPGDTKLGILFHRFMLQDLRLCVSKLDHQSFAELKSYKEPPVMVHSILKAVLLLFYPEWDDSEEIHSWNQCKMKVNSDLIRKIASFDPTAKSVHVQPEVLSKYIKGIPRGAVWKHGSIPAEHLYNWAFTCLSLLELTQKAQFTQQASLVTIPLPNGIVSENISPM